jgi:predicted small metal-binding protein
MAAEFTKIECPCGFTVQGHDADEVMQLVKTHAKQAHDHELTESELRGAMQTVPAPAGAVKA